jgi:hypothetical protein
MHFALEHARACTCAQTQIQRKSRSHRDASAPHGPGPIKITQTCPPRFQIYKMVIGAYLLINPHAPRPIPEASPVSQNSSPHRPQMCLNEFNNTLSIYEDPNHLVPSKLLSGWDAAEPGLLQFTRCSRARA